MVLDVDEQPPQLGPDRVDRGLVQDAAAQRAEPASAARCAPGASRPRGRPASRRTTPATRRRGGRGGRPAADGPPSASASAVAASGAARDWRGRGACGGRGHGASGGVGGPGRTSSVAPATAPATTPGGGRFRPIRENRAHVVRISARAGPRRPAGGSALVGSPLVVLRRRCSPRSSAGRPVVLVVVGAGRAVATCSALARRRRADPGVEVELDDDGYRVRLVRGAGVKAARWREVEDAVAGEPARRRLRGAATARRPDARASRWPRSPPTARSSSTDVRDHLRRGQGLRPLWSRVTRFGPPGAAL